jgi:hypothetical protein
MAEDDSGRTGLLMSLVLGIFLAAGLIGWASTGVTNSSTNPRILLPPATPCSRVADSFDTLQRTLQAYQFGNASIEDVNTARREFANVTARELSALAPLVQRALGPVRAELDKTAEIASQPGATNREIADQTQRVAATASDIPRLCPSDQS